MAHKNGSDEYLFSERLNRDMERLETLREQKREAGRISAARRYGQVKPDSKELDTKVAEFLKIYEAEIGLATPSILENLKDMSETYSIDDFRNVIAETEPKKRNLRYIEKVLETRLAGGVKERRSLSLDKPTGMKVNE